MTIWPHSISNKVEFTVSVKNDRLSGPMVNTRYATKFVETSKRATLPVLSDAEAAAQNQTQSVQYGMTKAQVEASAWGRPQRKEVAADAKGVTVEQWIYPGGATLIFTGDVLTSSNMH